MHTRRPLLALLVAALIVAPLTACSGGFPGSSTAEDAGARSVDAVESAPETADSMAPDSNAPIAGQNVIYSGDATLVVGDPVAAAEQTRELAESLGGYVESQTVSEADASSGARASLMLRVPADEFDGAFDGLAEIGELVDQSRSATDVTLQVVDLEARVDALQASVDRLTQLMAGAASTGELIEAEAALSQRQQELDSLRAQLQFLENQVRYSSLWVTLETEAPLPGGPANFWEGLLAGFDSMAQAGAAALVLFGVLLPWLLLVAAIVLLVLWLVHLARRRHAHSRVEHVSARPELPVQAPPA